MSASTNTSTPTDDELPPLARPMTEAEWAADWERLRQKVRAREQPGPQQDQRAPDSSSTPNSEPRTPNSKLPLVDRFN